jgi:hypothetical protein
MWERVSIRRKLAIGATTAAFFCALCILGCELSGPRTWGGAAFALWSIVFAWGAFILNRFRVMT